MSKARSSDVDDRCDGEWDEYQGSEGENKTPRQREGRCVARVLHLSKRITDKNESEWLESVAMTPQGIQSYLEEKEIVCCGWFLDTVDGWSPDTILLVLPNGMVETVGSIPSSISKHKQIRLWWNT